MSIVARTIGIEAEYQTGVEAMIRELYGRDVSSSDRVHSYHCACDSCEFIRGTNRNLFRAQQDATCAGEIITNPFTLGHLDEVVEHLEVAAYAADAEPGLNAGIHVHVGITHEDIGVRLGMIFAFGVYEQALGQLAIGPFRSLRGMNRSVAQSIPLAMAGSVTPETESQLLDRLLNLGDLPAQGRMYQHLVTRWERHANLSPARSHPTMEVRIWNSSRAAWRIAMYARISHHLASPDVITALIDRAEEWLPASDGDALDVDHQLTVLTEVLVAEDGALAEPIQRQRDSHAQLLSEPDQLIEFTLS